MRDPRGFLQQHIRQDLEQLTRTLGRSADEAINAVHLVLRSLLGRQRHPSGQSELEGRGGGWSLLTTPGTDKGSGVGCGDERREGWLLSLSSTPPGSAREHRGVTCVRTCGEAVRRPGRAGRLSPHRPETSVCSSVGTCPLWTPGLCGPFFCYKDTQSGVTCPCACVHSWSRGKGGYRPLWSLSQCSTLKTETRGKGRSSR